MKKLIPVVAIALLCWKVAEAQSIYPYTAIYGVYTPTSKERIMNVFEVVHELHHEDGKVTEERAHVTAESIFDVFRAYEAEAEHFPDRNLIRISYATTIVQHHSPLQQDDE
jgi:hypothetical protein